MEFFDQTLHELHEKLKKKEITSRSITESVLGRIRSVDGKIKAYITVADQEALGSAEAADKAMAQQGPRTPLQGIPVALKDNLCTTGVLTTCASKILGNFVPPYDATVVAKLRAEGAVFCGKANMDEFAMGSSTENSGYFTTRNPWDLDRIPGGSSGGSAAAVAAGECIAALGSDTGGSIRQPAACCGVVGLKPTYGRVSRYGLVAFASSLDQIGPITKDVRDAAIVLNAIAGRDGRDSTSADIPVPDFTKALQRDVKGLKIGIPKEYFIEGMDPEVERSVREAVKTLERLGATTVEVSLPHTGYAVATYYILATSEASSNLARYDGVKYGVRADGAKDLLDLYLKSRSRGFGAEVQRRIMLGTYALSAGYYDAYYKKGQQVRTLIKRDFDEAFKTVDIIATPTAPTAAFKIGEKSADPLQMYLSDIFTISVNLAGIPGISIPCGFTKGGLPIGLQILGRHFDEETVLRAAFAYEQATEWHKMRPKI
ncbi:MAG: aspartyl/glutamyl-tRNA amidotransferase subunit A [Nitrospirae bacterium GWC2_57_13]|jgi:aspartyl-tRNA(Asn)/glutamyl-tRNA(Gln) amidotransferase subunit A|nr:MAG: aspartyl/glutamyl-tRNA amidotransferase subunit A [Nitrospirae bacterium GWC1_57_7]OGW29484.1 MAG: aspartyl/glutamyl-tRNA amidotransferase subunit A [Nitrospirae bacterium GWC2_57_13]OGW45617.1 MAG: aspartyl/glutamyl-tRNA amidotransferase subunit A [Nitrospirae bacterium GWD2_57_8]